MFIGEYIHTIDEKKRLLIPTKMRKLLGSKAIITNGFEKCLAIYPLIEWENMVQKLSALPAGKSSTRALHRFIISGAVEADIDKVGRVLIPEFQKKFAGLNTKVVLAGVHDRIEIWDEKSWTTYKRQIEKQADLIAEQMSDEGAF